MTPSNLSIQHVERRIQSHNRHLYQVNTMKAPKAEAVMLPFGRAPGRQAHTTLLTHYAAACQVNKWPLKNPTQ